MKKLIIVLIFGLLSCEGIKLKDGLFVDVPAVFNYSGLAYDGCDTNITLTHDDSSGSTKTYITSLESKKTMEKFIETEQAKLASGDYLRSFDVKISYKKTGKMGELICGWGHKQTLEEIYVAKISR